MGPVDPLPVGRCQELSYRHTDGANYGAKLKGEGITASQTLEISPLKSALPNAQAKWQERRPAFSAKRKKRKKGTDPEDHPTQYTADQMLTKQSLVTKQAGKEGGTFRSLR